MESELVDVPLSVEEGTTKRVPVRLHSEIFEKCFPAFLAIGMTAEEYWDGEAELPQWYMQAERLKQKRENELAWLNGLYVYHALCNASPLLGFKKSKPEKYPKEPFDIFAETDTEEEKERKEKAHYEDMKARISASFKRFNAQRSQNG